jgi:APA family basic amino acid/polyamine antiporter
MHMLREGGFDAVSAGAQWDDYCYAEFALMTPTTSSAYTYSYATMGEIKAWIIGWYLVLEYVVSAATIGIMAS